MHEIELKLGIPPLRLAQVVADVQRGGDSVPMKAVYFDTPDRRLSKAQVSLRLRQEDGRWVQTVKAPQATAARRLEHNAPRDDLGADAGPLLPDLALHDGTAAGAALREALEHGGTEGAALQETFRTDVQRRRKTSRAAGARVEIALDEGALIAGRRRQAIHEIEFELKSGRPAGVFALARRWVKKHGLWLDSRSKAERGHWLARGTDGAPPHKAGQPAGGEIKQARREVDLLRALVNAALSQVMANASEIAAGRETVGHVHQLRVGLRRLRTALRAFGEAAPDLAAQEPALAEVFRALGAWRDPGVTRDSIAPQLREAGAPAVDLPRTRAEDIAPQALVRGTHFQLALLSLLEFGLDAISAGDDGEAEAEPLDDVIAARLSKLHKQVRRDGRRFDELPADDQHRVRKRLKRLRYLAEFVAPRYKHHAVKRYLAALKPAQDALGVHNDALVAIDRYRAAAASNPEAWFAVGWLTARLPESAAAGSVALKAIGGAKRFW